MTIHEAITDELSDEQIAARLAAVQAGVPPTGNVIQSNGFRYFRPLVEAADEYINWALKPEERVYLGIPAFDAAMRGIAPGELALVIGYAHSGKTVLITEMIMHNRTKPIVLFTPDETRVLVLVKLASIIHGLSAERLEERIAEGDDVAQELIRNTALAHFPHLHVYEEGLDVRQMTEALNESRQVWGTKEAAVIFDYADLLQGAGEDVTSKLDTLKAWGKGQRFPLVVLHQSSRTAGADGAEVTIHSGGYGGEQQSTFVLGVRRKRDQFKAQIRDLEERIRTSSKDTSRLDELLSDARYQLGHHQDTVTFSLVKNKRPPSRLVEDTDFFLDPRTGRIRPLDDVKPGSMAYVRRVQAWTQERIDV